MNESDLTQELMSACRVDMRGAIVLKHADKINTGYPDFTVTWAHMTSWWEVKLWDEGPFESPELQEIMCKRLASQGYCRYVIYEQRRTVRRVIVAHPFALDQWTESPDVAPGFSHLWVA